MLITTHDAHWRPVRWPLDISWTFYKSDWKICKSTSGFSSSGFRLSFPPMYVPIVRMVSFLVISSLFAFRSLFFFKSQDQRKTVGWNSNNVDGQNQLFSRSWFPDFKAQISLSDGTQAESFPPFRVKRAYFFPLSLGLPRDFEQFEFQQVWMMALRSRFTMQVSCHYACIGRSLVTPTAFQLPLF